MKKIIGILILVSIVPFIHGMLCLSSGEGVNVATYWFFMSYALEVFMALMALVVYKALIMVGVKFN